MAEKQGYLTIIFNGGTKIKYLVLESKFQELCKSQEIIQDVYGRTIVVSIHDILLMEFEPALPDKTKVYIDLDQFERDMWIELQDCGVSRQVFDTIFASVTKKVISKEQ